MITDRLGKTFDHLRGKSKLGIIPFLTVGYPDIETTLEIVPALEKAGASIFELGVPFSDPLADGPTIQQASLHALQQGVNLPLCLDICGKLRNRGVNAPLVLMGYYNPILTMGIKEYAKKANEVGLDGTIVADLPPEESTPFRDACRNYGIHLIPLLAPTSKNERIAKACSEASGFIYNVSIAGVTGARDKIPTDLPSMVERIRSHTNLPIAVGFGLSSRKHMLEVEKFADAAVVGSALINTIGAAPPGKAISSAQTFIAELNGNTTLENKEEK